MNARGTLVFALFAACAALRCSDEPDRVFRDGSGGKASGAGGAVAATAGRSGGGAGQGGEPSEGTTAGHGGKEVAPVGTQGGSGGSEGGESNANGGASGAPSSLDAGATGVSGQGGASEAAGGAPAQGGATSTCPAASSRCVKAAPSGWQGPVLVSSNAVSACPSAFPTRLPSLYGGLVAGSASCSCTCGEASTTCGGTASATFYSSNGCNDAVHGSAVTEKSCTSSPPSTSMTYVAQVSATCGAGTVVRDVATPQWTQTLNLCGEAVQQGSCTASDELCLQNPGAPFAAKYCITSATDQACPAAFPARARMAPSYSDTRSCPSTCSCNASGQACELEVDVYSQSGCSGTLTRKHVTTSSVCVVSNSTSQVSYYAERVVSNPGTCSPNASLNYSGSVTEGPPVTICCTE